MTTITTLTDGLAMVESARWHDGRFWCSDWVAGELLAIPVDGARDGTPEVVTRSTSFPFCFDWTADGTLVVTGGSGLERLGPGRRPSCRTPICVICRRSAGTRWRSTRRGTPYVNGINFDMRGVRG